MYSKGEQVHKTQNVFLIELIERASKEAGNDNKLAKALDVGRSAVSDWKAGRKTCPAGDVALMAEIAGLDPSDWTCRAVAAQYDGTEKGKRLREALKKALVATGGAMLTSGAEAASSVLFKTSEAWASLWAKINLLYTMYKRKQQNGKMRVLLDLRVNIRALPRYPTPHPTGQPYSGFAWPQVL